MTLTTHFHLLLGLRKNGAVLPLPVCFTTLSFAFNLSLKRICNQQINVNPLLQHVVVIYRLSMAHLHLLVTQTTILWSLSVFGTLEHHQVSDSPYLTSHDSKYMSRHFLSFRFSVAGLLLST